VSVQELAERLWWAGVAVSCAAIVLAWWEREDRREHGPIAWLFSVALVADLVRQGLAAWVLGDGPPGGRPYTGALRAAFHLDQALTLCWPAGLVVVGVVVLAKAPDRGALRGVAIGAGAVLAVLVARYPDLRRAPLAEAWRVIEFGALASVALCWVAWWTRPHETKPERPNLTLGSVIVISCIDAGSLAACHQPWGPPHIAAQIVYLIGFAALVVLHAGERVWRLRPLSSSR
jgi:hypothetical protein